MKRIFITLLLIMTYCLPTYASEQDIVNSFTNFTNNIVAEIQDSYNKNPYKVRFYEPLDIQRKYYNDNGHWYKISKCNLRSSIDIQRTDSLITPYIGYFTLNSDTINYYSSDNPKGEYRTREEAEKASLQRLSISETEYRFSYAYQNGQWVLKLAEWKDPDLTNGLWKEGTLSTPQSNFVIK